MVLWCYGVQPDVGLWQQGCPCGMLAFTEGFGGYPDQLWAGDGGGDRARRPDEDMGSRQADRKRRSRASVQVVPPRARRGLVADNSPYRSPRSPATKRFQPASNLFPGALGPSSAAVRGVEKTPRCRLDSDASRLWVGPA